MSRTGPLELLGIDHLLTEEERDIQATVREFVEQRVKPNIADWYERGNLDLGLIRAAGLWRSMGVLEPPRSLMGSPASSWRPATLACAAWSRCRVLLPCSRSGSS